MTRKIKTNRDCVCGGNGYVDEWLPASDQPNLIFYYIVCDACNSEEGGHASIDDAWEEWNKINAPENNTR